MKFEYPKQHVAEALLNTSCFDKRIEFSKSEIDILRKAFEICNQADTLSRQDVDTVYGVAATDIQEVLDSHL